MPRSILINQRAHQQDERTPPPPSRPRGETIRSRSQKPVAPSSQQSRYAVSISQNIQPAHRHPRAGRQPSASARYSRRQANHCRAPGQHVEPDFVGERPQRGVESRRVHEHLLRSRQTAQVGPQGNQG